MASLCLLSAGQKVGARRGLSASKGKIKILKKGKGITKAPQAQPAKKTTLAACEVPRRGKRVEGRNQKFKKR